MDGPRSTSHGRRLVAVGDVELCAEPFGSPDDPTLLLISGSSSPMDAYDAAFCEQLVAGGRHVIRYDNRDTGESTSYPPGQPGYGFDDIVGDALGLLDALEVRDVHVAGGSMGGAVARGMALRQPSRVRSLTLISSSPMAPGDPRDPALPGPTEAFLAFAGAERPEPDWTDRDAYVDNYVLWDRQYAGARFFDEAESRAYAGQVFDRTRDLHAASVNHGVAERGSTAIRSRHAEIDCPVLVIHGTADPILPLRHAEVLVEELPDAELLALPGVGHQLLPREWWPAVVPAILAVTQGPRGA